MTKNFIVNRIKAYNSVIYALMLVVAILFIIMSSSIMQKSIDDGVERANNKFTTINDFLVLKLEGADQIIYGLARSLSQGSIDINNRYLNKLINNFDSSLDRYKAVPFSGFKVLDHNDDIIKYTLVPEHIFKPMHSLYDLSLLESARKRPFELQIGAIRFGMQNKEEIIPLCMAISDANRKYVGAICSALSVQKINKQLSDVLLSKHTTKIRLLNQSYLSDNLDKYRASEVLTTSNILKHYFQNKSLLIRQPLRHYPIIAEI